MRVEWTDILTNMKKNINFNVKRILAAILLLLTYVTMIPATAFAFDEQFYSQNDIFFYTPEGTCTEYDLYNSNKNIYIIGDSYAQGLKINGIENKLQNAGYTVSGYNADPGRSISRPGNNIKTSGLQALEQDSSIIQSSGTALVVLGTNGDISKDSISEFMNKLKSYNSNIRTFWVNINYIKNGKQADVQERNKIIANNASELNYSIVDWYAATKNDTAKYLDVPDNEIHPNTLGYSTLIDLTLSNIGSGTASISAKSGGGNLDYRGKQVLTPAQQKSLEANIPAYQKAADKVGIPWQLIAAVHYKEHGFQRDGPDNGQGPFQISTGGYKVGEYSDDEFQDSANKAASIIKSKSDDRDLSNIDNVKYTLFAYNGTAGVYKEQAIKLGFSDIQAENGEGSPYVMNKYDAKRDPTVEPTKSNGTWGQVKVDHGSIEYPANSGYGTFVIYELLSGISGKSGCTSGDLVNGGMNLEQAKEFVKKYKDSPEESVKFLSTAAYTDCNGGILANCVAFSVYFINRYTNLSGFKEGTTGHGKEIVKNIVDRNPNVTQGSVPRPYAIFSSPATEGNDAGHTGVILGVNIEKDIVITGEASCSRGFDWTNAYQYKLSDFNSDKTYAYLEGYLSGI